MPKLKILSGREVIAIFLGFDFSVVSQRGSHVKLQRTLKDGVRQTLTIPNHDYLDKGTLKAIYRQALRYIAKEDLNGCFYHL